ncbi:hypothetical protein R1flu_017452 [Riccia fluitans]|uniref:Uncharacterized protein n=1 Tax=Riccia fluitans TaxID=41844 RepID=A0ABD1ZH06_9MARC
MGYAIIPEHSHEGRNYATLDLDRSELAHTVTSLQNILHNLKSIPNKEENPPPTKVAPAPYTPALLAVPRPSSSHSSSKDLGTAKGHKILPSVNVITPSVAALQQRLGVDVGSGLSVGFDSAISPTGISALSGGLPYVQDKVQPPIARPRSPLRGFLSDAAGSGQLQTQIDFRNFSSGPPDEVLESSLRLLGIADEVEPFGAWRGGADEDKFSARHLGLDEIETSKVFNQPGNTLTSTGPSIWEATRAPSMDGNFSDSTKRSPPALETLTPGLGFGVTHGTGGVVKGQQPPFGPIRPQGGTHLRNEAGGASLRTGPESVGSSNIGQMQMPGLQFPAEKLGDTTANQRFMASGLMAPRQENAVPVLAPPGSIINNDWQGVMEVGGQGQAWKVPPGQQGALSRSNSQTQTDLVRIPEDKSQWRGRWTTAAAEHNRECVTGMVYVPLLEGLEGGEAFTGWLVSSSRRMLNLWECTSYTRPAEPALQVMHSQSTEFVMESMDVDTAAKLFLSFCAHPRDQGYCISLHSLAAESFFSYKGMIRVPSAGVPPRKQGFTTGSRICHVTSLQPLGGPLRSSIAAGIGQDVFVYELASATVSPSVNAQPKAQWKAHAAPISAMHRSSFACALLTGASDGSIRLWDLKTKPNAPVRQYAHSKQVIQVAMLDPNTIGSCGADGLVNIWDIRSSAGALFSVNPDRTPIINLAVGPSGRIVAFTTRKSLYCLELAAQGGSAACLSPLVPLPPAGPSVDMKWNSKTSQLYVCGVDGTIDVYVKS